VLPLATAYAVTEAFGMRKGVDLDYRRAPAFFGLFTALLALGAAVALVPGVPLIPLLVGVQVLNGALLPIMLVFIMLLVNDRPLVRDLGNGRLQNVLGWGTTILVGLAVTVLLGSQLLGLLDAGGPGGGG
jgi:Mn2+/Fe2+ NRAMP family transporter